MSKTENGEKRAGEDVHALSRRYRREHDADVVLCNAQIDNDLFWEIATACLNQERPARNAVLILLTYGGSPDAAYKIARFFQEHYAKFTVFVPSQCKSAGTIIVIGANDIVMSPYGELGPLDVQVLKEDELFEISSGAAIVSALDMLKEKSYELFESFMLETKSRSGGTITLRTSADIAASMSSSLYKEVFQQINPQYLGEMNRNMRIAYEYGKRLARYGKNIEERVIHSLIYDYPDHSFVIDRREAESIFHNVEDMGKELVAIYRELGRRAVMPSLKPDVELLSASEPDAMPQADKKKTTDRPNARKEEQGEQGEERIADADAARIEARDRATRNGSARRRRTRGGGKPEERGAQTGVGNAEAAEDGR